VDNHERIPLQQREAIGGNDKFTELYDKSTNFVPPKSFATQLYEYIWGKDRATLQFESALAQYEQSQLRKKNKYGKKRLGSAEVGAGLTPS